jgi:hypothetical protein
VVIDDIQLEVIPKEDRFTEHAGILISWLLEMKNQQLMNIVMVTNEANTIHDLLVKSKPSYSLFATITIKLMKLQLDIHLLMFDI